MADINTPVGSDEEPEKAPVIVAPLPGIPSAGFATGAASMPGSLISPPVFAENADTPGHASLASRIEQTLAEDGRFAGFLSHLQITVDSGLVHLAGLVPSASQKHSLLSAIHGVPGVAAVSDALEIG